MSDDIYYLNGEPVEYTPMTLDQRQRQRKLQDQVAERIKTEVAERTTKPETREQMVLRTHKERLSTLKSQRRSVTPQERAAIDRRVAMLQTEVDRLEGQATEQSRREKLGADRLVQLARDQADVLERSWRTIYPHAREEDVLLYLELSRAETWDSAEACHRACAEIAEKISSDNLEAERKLAADADLAAQRATADHLNAVVRVKEGEARLAQI